MDSPLVLVNLFKRYGASNVAIGWDVDLTLRNTMERETPPEEHVAFMELYLRTDGGTFVMTGRSSDSVDETLSGQFPGSFEHHSAIRVDPYGPVYSLAPKVDTTLIGQKAAELIGERIKVVRTPHAVIEAEGKYACVYPEVKNYAVALVHSLGHSDVENVRTVLREVAEKILLDLNIGNTHKVVVGSDAIEIAPNGLSANSEADIALPDSQIQLLRDTGLSKASALHNFMSLPAFAQRTPFIVGDSGTDGKAMNVAYASYEGGGAWVKNGKDVPEEFRSAVADRVIPDFPTSWNHIHAANAYLRSLQTKIVCLPENFAYAPSEPR